MLHLVEEKDNEIIKNVQYDHKQNTIVSHHIITIPISISFQHIPIVDLSLSINEIANQVNTACKQVGFFYIVNHGIPLLQQQSVFDIVKKFFALPPKIKENISITKSKGGMRGYFRLGEEDLNGKDSTRDLSTLGGTVDNSSLGDWKEGFDCGREVSCQHPLHGPNQWVDDKILPGFKEILLTYQDALLSVADILLIAFAMSLNLDSNYFIERTRNPVTTLRIIHYPPSLLNNNVGCGAHTDYGCYTLLNQDSVGGLEVMNHNNQWINVTPIPNSFVINIGDMMSRWTNGKFASTIHRVYNRSEVDRYSIPMFLNPDIGTNIECLPSCIDNNNIAKFPPITSEELLLQRYQQTFKHLNNNDE